jgi:hypothetical protein
MNVLKYSLILLLFSSSYLFSQQDPIEIYLIDAYSVREAPHNFKLSFYTSEIAKSRVVLYARGASASGDGDEYEFDVAKELTDLHKAEIEIHDLSFSNNVVEFIIITEMENRVIDTSEVFDFDLPYEPKLKGGSDFFTLCLFGGAIFLLPYPNYIFNDSQNYFSLTKEIPIISFRGGSTDYPSGYLSLEYTYIFDSGAPNYLRAGYKKLFELSHIEYVSPGVSLYTNFSSNHGISPEFSVGLFTIKDTFTFYARYRYNINLSGSGRNFNEISIGLYSAFFSLYL